MAAAVVMNHDMVDHHPTDHADDRHCVAALPTKRHTHWYGSLPSSSSHGIGRTGWSGMSVHVLTCIMSHLSVQDVFRLTRCDRSLYLTSTTPTSNPYWLRLLETSIEK